MVKNCMKNSQGFVIVFQKPTDSIDDFEISKKGSYVEIIDFNNLPNGLLGISVKSINKVVVNNLIQLKDGLHIAEINPLVDPEDSVAYHLAGLIPIPWTSKQNLLEAFDASQRLKILSKYIDEISSN